jgi:hypothetical protein
MREEIRKQVEEQGLECLRELGEVSKKYPPGISNSIIISAASTIIRQSVARNPIVDFMVEALEEIVSQGIKKTIELELKKKVEQN